ncbi:hypothetical protein J421_5859 (plasmid) [Gemmatirosa kalamazoonensis]|uniref:Glycosyl-hydrolase 97 N-terminal domain-containing protein n=1 Tax=Gemmatirosa kalamazoonensis TaxID=861299 RepID=W0RQY0_9BACT|nr:glycoside hydrolase family 97 N-terminal domain-containing protein [Gemmatirosa kalamazoonensis]AHG93394.1 hypothetical protein J421_5859 [Gemmatirosa kalamazoonensis]
MFRPSVAARLAAVLLAGAGPLAAQAPAASVTSPDGRIVVRATLDSLGAPRYALDRDGRALLLPSRLGFAFRGAPPLDRGLVLVDTTRAAHVRGRVPRGRRRRRLPIRAARAARVRRLRDRRQPAFAFIRDVPVDWDTTVAITTRAVTSATRLRMVLAPGGGQAIRIRAAR